MRVKNIDPEVTENGDGEKTYRHPSFGAIVLTRTSGRNNLFGSSVEHHSYFTMSIHKAVLVRSLSTEKIHAEKELIEVCLTPIQLAEMMFQVGCAAGTPCTINCHRDENGKMVQIPDPPVISNKSDFLDDFKKKLAKVASEMDEVCRMSKDLVADKAPTKAKREILASKIRMVQQEIGDNLPFVLEMFNEKVESVTAEAKAALNEHKKTLDKNPTRLLGDEGDI